MMPKIGPKNIFFRVSATFVTHFYYLQQTPEFDPRLNTVVTWMPFSTSKFPLAPMGVLAPLLSTLDGSARPLIDTSGNLLAHVSAESPLNISPNL